MLVSSLRAAVAAGAFALILLPATAGATQSPQEISFSGAYLAGRTAGKLRDNEQASSYFTQALEADANNPLLIERIFLLEVSQGNIPAAEDFAGRVLAFNSQHRMARIVLGLKNFRAYHYEAARRDFAAASYTPVGELTAGLLTAWTYAGEGQLTPALKALDKLDSNESFANFKTFHAALIADYLGNATRAEESYKKARDQAGASLRIVQAYGNFLQRHGRAAEAEQIYQGYLNGGGANPLVLKALDEAKAGIVPPPFIGSPAAGAAESMFSLATAMTDDRNIDVGLMYAQLALSFDADKPVMVTLLGDIYEDIQQPQKAIDAYSQVPAASPLRTNADMEIAVNLQRLDKRSEAVSTLENLVAQQPDNYDALVTLGNVLRNGEDFAKAAVVYDKAIALITQPVKDNWRVYYYDGISYERLKQWDKAEKFFRRALELSPDEPMVLNYLGYSMVEKRLNLQEALQMISKAVSLKPNDGYIVDSLGWAYYQLGDFDQALVNCERAVDLLPADPIIGEHLGDVYWRVDRRLEARFQWQHAKDNKPEPDDLKRIEDKLQNGLTDPPPVRPAQNGTTGNNG
jgi:tetratricopeptide (TPR) repeat protein